MNINPSIRSAIRTAIEETNLQLEEGVQLYDDDDQVILGEGSPLDSLGLLLFVTEVESKLKANSPKLDLVDLLMSAEHEADFKTVGALKQYLNTLA